jgi:hypothetical protein
MEEMMMRVSYDVWLDAVKACCLELKVDFGDLDGWFNFKGAYYDWGDNPIAVVKYAIETRERANRKLQ